MSRGVAIFGATGLVGRTTLALLEAREFPLERLRLIASDRSGGRPMRFRGADVAVEGVGPAVFEGVDLALFAVPNALAEQWAPVARAAGVRVIDYSSVYRYDAGVPLVVPEINGRLLEAGPMLVANPNCSAAGLVMALAPLSRMARLTRVVTTTYQSVSGAGAEALEELESGVRAGLEGDPPARAGGAAPFAFNVVPQIDRFEDNGYTREEMKIAWEIRKILELPELPVSATAARVPVRVGHSASVYAEFETPVTPEQAREAWRAFPGVLVVDEPANARYPTPLEAAGRDEVLVGRARASLAKRGALEFFIASDNLRKGAALNAVQIAECLAARAGAAR